MGEEEVKLQLNPDGWGPMAGLPPFAKTYEGLMFSVYDKTEAVGKLCDFLTQTGRREREKLEKQEGINVEAGDSAFTFVESKSALKSKKPAYKPPNTWQKRQGGPYPPQFVTTAGGKQTSGAMQQQSNYTRAQQAAWQKKQQLYHQQQQQRYIARTRMYKDPSYSIQQTWISIRDFNKHHFEKLTSGAGEATTVAEVGELSQYITNFDRVIPKKPVPLRHLETQPIYPELLSDDTIQRLAEGNTADVYITDEALAILMTAPRSVYSWDLTVQKFEDVLFVDYSENSRTQLMTVNENASEPPAAEVKEAINQPLKLHLESTSVNHFFRQQAVNPAETKKFSEENLFKETYNDFPNYMYRYRVFKLPGGMRVCVRCQVEGLTKRGDEEVFVKIGALNQYEPGRKGNWRSTLETHRGAALNQEILNNGCKVARWACQAYLGGAETIRLGLVSRVSGKSAERHQVMGVAEYETKGLFQQINLNMKQAWGTARLLLESVQQLQDASYLLYKEPTKMVVKVYEKPGEEGEEED